MLSEIIEDEVTHEYSYDVFEPTVGLEIAGRNIFNELGLDGAKIVVIMHFLEIALGETLRLIDSLTHEQKDEYEFWLLGSEYGIELERRDNVLDVVLQVGYQHSSGQYHIKGAGKRHEGLITVKDWVEAVVRLAKEMSDLFERLNPQMYPSLKGLESKRKALELWLALHRNGGNSASGLVEG